MKKETQTQQQQPQNIEILDYVGADDVIPFSEEWLNVADYELKILILASILAENNLAYRGTLTTMCEWLGVKQNTNNNNNIKTAIFSLQEKGYIFYKLDGRTWTITISEKGMKDKQIVKIRKAWVTAFRSFNKNNNNKRIDNSISIDWIKILKVFVYLYSRKSASIITLDTIANALNISKTTVATALKVLEQCELDKLKFYKVTVRSEKNINGEKFYTNIGSDMGFIVMFEN